MELLERDYLRDLFFPVVTIGRWGGGVRINIDLCGSASKELE